LPLLLPAEEAAYYLALLMAAAIGAAAQALVFRVWERRRGAVFLQKAGRTWGFPPLYSAVPGGERWLRSAGVPLQNGPGLIRPV
jgi:2-polyprenyl-6-methoxyphenol hydroxylase-like FAD-dependent oxidoreductase